jgi:hypothetical protein
LSISVDFAKHGECVTKEVYSEMRKQAHDYPVFIESNFKWQLEKRRESTGVLGKLFSEVSEDKSKQ